MENIVGIIIICFMGALALFCIGGIFLLVEDARQDIINYLKTKNETEVLKEWES